MLFIVRGKSSDRHDRVLRIEAESIDQAEAIGWARGIFVTEVISHEEQKQRRSLRIAAVLAAVRRFVLPRTLHVLGRPVSAAQSVAFLVGGVAVWALDLRAFNFI